MKNDFREFYDKNYIAHNMTNETDELTHADWASNLRKYVDKVRTKSGKWKYIYPEDLKRDISYSVRNAVSKVTGKNKTFKKTARDRYNDYQNYRTPYGSMGKDKPIYTNTTYRTTRNGNKKIVTATTSTHVPDYEYIQRIARSKHNVRTTAARSQQDSNSAYQNFKVKAPNGKYYSARPEKQTDYSKKMSDVAKKKAASAASKKQSSKIHGEYAIQQKKKAAGVVSRAQKAKNYSEYATQQKKKAAGVVSRAQKAKNYGDYAEKQKKKASALALRSKNRQLNADYQKKRDMYEFTYGGRKKYKKYSGSLRNR